MKKILILMLIISFFSGSVYAADALYVQSVKAKLLSGAKFSSAAVGEVKRGDKLEVIKSEGRWYQVTTGPLTGWVYQVTTGPLTGWVNKLCVGERPPMAKVSVIKGNKFNLEDKARKRVSSFTSAGAARGLTPAERKRLNSQSLADYESLRELEELAGKITEREIEAFVLSREGDLR